MIWYISDETSFKGVEKNILRLLVSASLTDPTYGKELFKKNNETDIQHNSENCRNMFNKLEKIGKFKSNLPG